MIGSGATCAGGAKPYATRCSACHPYRAERSTPLKVRADRQALAKGLKIDGQTR